MENQQNHDQGQPNQGENSNGRDFIIGSFIGGLVGAAVALIFAPKAGKELRDDISQGTNYVKERAEEWKDVAYVKGSEWKDRAVETSSDISRNVSEKSQELGSRVKETSKSVQNKVRDLTNSEDEAEEAAEEVAEAIEEAAEELEKQQAFTTK